ncbi:MAG TPA: metal-dependent phosphohydrolase [Syntrophobacteraceae bacterium]|nr:metal-dependent phosphohydrolase [Syntrophobacteraceae bacterium]
MKNQKPTREHPSHPLEVPLGPISETIFAKSCFGDDLTSRIKRLCQIGVALSAEKNLNALLIMILTEARRFTKADAGTLYLADQENRLLRFEILQNDTLMQQPLGREALTQDLPPILLEISGKPNHCNVSSYVALTGKTVNIPDVYDVKDFDFTGPRKYDTATGYRSKSMLVVPMKNHENEIIGVLQLINAKDPITGEIIAFSEQYLELIASLASQAAVALSNAQLIQNLKDLFQSFIKSIATAVDEKSPYTGGHIRRVVELSTLILRHINETRDGPFAEVHFSEEEIEETRMAAWMHDIGKITTPEHVINKRTRLETIVDRIDLVETRFELIRQTILAKSLALRLRLLEGGIREPSVLENLERDRELELETLEADRLLVRKINQQTETVTDEELERLRETAEKTYELDGRQYPYLTADEVCNLSVRKGNLTGKERQVIEEHAIMTFEILKELPFPKNLSRVLAFASAHHEKLDGSGYPFRCSSNQLPLQSRIIAFADIFESLTAQDRPYKKPLKLTQAMEILKHLGNDRHIDPDLYELVITRGIHEQYAQAELPPSQIDSNGK